MPRRAGSEGDEEAISGAETKTGHREAIPVIHREGGGGGEEPAGTSRWCIEKGGRGGGEGGGGRAKAHPGEGGLLVVGAAHAAADEHVVALEGAAVGLEDDHEPDVVDVDVDGVVARDRDAHLELLGEEGPAVERLLLAARDDAAAVVEVPRLLRGGEVIRMTSLLVGWRSCRRAWPGGVDSEERNDLRR